MHAECCDEVELSNGESTEGQDGILVRIGNSSANSGRKCDASLGESVVARIKVFALLESDRVSTSKQNKKRANSHFLHRHDQRVLVFRQVSILHKELLLLRVQFLTNSSLQHQQVL